MKKIILIFAAMMSMAQVNAATPDAAVNTDATGTEVAPTTMSSDDERTYHNPFKDNDENKKHWTVTTDGFYFGMGVHHNWETINNSFEIGLLNIAAVTYNSLHGQKLSLGMGIQHRSYSMKRPNMLVRDNNGVVSPTTYPTNNVDEIKNRSSNLNMWTLQFPLMFKQKIVSKLNIGVAGILNWNTYARVDNHYEINKTDYDTHFKGLKQNKINFDFMGTIFWDDFGIYGRYSPGKFFKEGYGPEIKETWTMGIIIAM